jgi:mannose/fructose-specific phosphotransferase system component IIA
MKLVALLPFMESEEIKELALKIINGEVKGIKLVILYPFLRNEDLDEIIELCIENNRSKDVNYALPFASKETIAKIHKGVEDGTLTGINSHMLFPFLGKEQRKSIFDDLVKQATEKAAQESDKEDDLYDEEEIEIEIDEE